MTFRVLVKTNHCLPWFLKCYGLDLSNVEIKDYRDVEEGVKTCVLIGDGRRIKKVLRSISSFMSVRDFGWVII